MVIAIVAVLIGLLLPAVQRCRRRPPEPSARTTSSRWVSAFTITTTPHGRLPADWSAGTSFYGVILPFIEQGNQGTAWTTSYSNIFPVKIFICRPAHRGVGRCPQ